MPNETTERAELALMVIGPERRERLIARYADGLSLTYGMAPEAARRYATPLVDEADPMAIMAVGQVWSQRDGKTLPGSELISAVAAKTYKVTRFTDDGMVAVNGGGLYLNRQLFADMWLTAWPDTYTFEDEPQPPGAALPQPEDAGEEPDEQEGRFDPRSLWILAHRATKDGVPRGEGLPLLGPYYRAVNWHNPEYKPSYGNALDVPVYLAEHLADYRAGWPDFRDQYNRNDWMGYFNELGTCEVEIEVAAYLGHWLWQRARADVVSEYGGSVDDYDVMHMWSPTMADIVIEAAPYAHPEWEIPSDHRLAQCEGQVELFGEFTVSAGEQTGGGRA